MFLETLFIIAFITGTVLIFIGLYGTVLPDDESPVLGREE